ncbi:MULTISPECIES: alpha-L-arabinofuranosidase C-terminal domain-containing protein [Bradyrhizobium]|uniref:alpha-L-arabinofuranosidase C-terminal domain-containing protein n=1 Tax=Bradyrhizobium TaxID=374 RepID=UPI001FCFB27E|nr:MULTISPECIES: alpha-L-arabinofuranosidase C-terminal domain-containing protein [Bradyrhizobium]UWU68091.1 hypothetical protein N2602_34040 [Bradyrhizobium sp. NC92]
MEDALAFGGACISLLNHADRVKVACLAQLVNVIAPIMTETGGGAWRQTIFFPFAHMGRLGRGRVLRTQVEAETYEVPSYDRPGIPDQLFSLSNVPYLKMAAVAGDDGCFSLFLLNRDLQQQMEVSVEARSFGRLSVREALELRHHDLQATNSKDAPERVKPEPLRAVGIEARRVLATLKPASWNVVHLAPS